jgi:hypothetical protein
MFILFGTTVLLRKAAMYVRVKKIGARRYVYLAEGQSRNGGVRQKTLAYLGPIVKVAAGVPDQVEKKVGGKIGIVDWKKINMDIRKIPLEFAELQEMKRNQLPTVIRIRQGGRKDGRGRMPRTAGELTALAIIAKKGFNEMFERVGERTYRMRIR